MGKYQPNQSLEQDLNHLLWKDVHEDNESFPTNKPLLAHYTSVATFDQIVSNDEIWLSNPLYMNDLEELRFGMNEGAVIFRSHKKLQGALRTKENHLNLVQKFDFLFKKFDQEHAFTYIFYAYQSMKIPTTMASFRCGEATGQTQAA